MSKIVYCIHYIHFYLIWHYIFYWTCCDAFCDWLLCDRKLTEQYYYSTSCKLVSFDFQSHVYMDSYNQTIKKATEDFAHLQNALFHIPQTSQYCSVVLSALVSSSKPLTKLINTCTLAGFCLFFETVVCGLRLLLWQRCLICKSRRGSKKKRIIPLKKEAALPTVCQTNSSLNALLLSLYATSLETHRSLSWDL